jgi:integrase
MGRLNKTFIAKIRKPGNYGDGDNLWLQVKPGKTGLRMSWLFRFQLGDKQRAMGLGPYPDVDIESAREAARLARLAVRDGRDPIALRRADVQKAVETHSYAEVASMFIERKSTQWCKERTQGVRTQQRKYVLPIIGDIPVDEIGKREILSVIEPLWEPHAAISVDILSQIRGVLNYAAFHGWRDPTAPNPCEWTGNLEHALPPNKRHEIRVHRPSAHWRDIATIMNELQVLEGEPQLSPVGLQKIAARVIRFQILTAVRPEEARDAVWDEIDLDRALWTLPKERMKARREHIVPLSAPAMQILQSQYQNRYGRYVFNRRWSRKQDDLPLTGGPEWRLLAKLRRIDKNGDEITLHGFRATFANFARERAYPMEVTELCLAHSIDTQTRKAYFTSSVLEQRRRLMEDWGLVCTGQWPTTADVLPFVGRSA